MNETAPTVPANTGSPVKDEIIQALEKEATALTPGELVELRGLLYERAKNKRDEFKLPEVKITDDDRQRFATCVERRKPFSERITLGKAKLQLTFREKLKSENDAIYHQISLDFAAGELKSEGDFTTRLNNYNLMIQLVRFNDELMPAPIPETKPEGWTLRNALANHPVEKFTNSNMWLALAALSQFDLKILKLEREIISENFFEPAELS
jgi:hypothetical protein